MTYQPPEGQGQPGYPPYQQGPQTWPQQGQPYPPQQAAPYGQPPYQQGPASYSQPPGPPPGPPRRRQRVPWYRRPGVLAAIGGVAALAIIGSAMSGGHKQTPTADTAATTAPAYSTAAPTPDQTQRTPTTAPETITYITKGTPGADVTYGAAGSSYQGTVPMRITRQARDVAYYSIQAQLQGSGSVTVEIFINGKLISSGRASGGYNIAMAEISKDPFTGDWEDTQG